METILSPLMKKILSNRRARYLLRIALKQSTIQRQTNPSIIKVDGKQYILKLTG